jgi:putative oxidoreductase
MKQLFSTQQEWIGLVLRLILGGIMLPHGAQKMFGWFGGYGYDTTMKFFTDTMKLPVIVAFLVIFLEFFGAIGLLIGVASRLWAIGLIAIMIGAIITTNFKHGFFMNWFGNQSGEGYEYHLLIIGICIAILIVGSGRFSLDGLIERSLSQ